MAVADLGRCPQCGHSFYNAWEQSRHAIGKHHYRAWTDADKRRAAEEDRKRRAQSARKREARD